MPHGDLHLYVEGALNLKNTALVGKCSPYCILTVGTQDFKTKVVTDGGSRPYWNQTFEYKIDRSTNHLMIKIMAKNSLRDDDVIGECNLAFVEVFREKHSVPVTAYPVTRGGKHHGDIRLGLKFHAKKRPAHLDPSPGPLLQPRRPVLSPVPSLDPVASFDNTEDSSSNDGSSRRLGFGRTADDAPSQSSRHPSYDIDWLGRRNSLPLDLHPPPANQLRRAQSAPSPVHAQQQPPLAPPPFQDERRRPVPVPHVEEYDAPVWRRRPGPGEGPPSRDGSSHGGSSHGGSSHKGSGHGGSGYGGSGHGGSGHGGRPAPAPEYARRPNNAVPPPLRQSGLVYNDPGAAASPPLWQPRPVHNVPGTAVRPGLVHNVPVVAPVAASRLKTPNRVEPVVATRGVDPGDFSFADVPQLADVPSPATVSTLPEMPTIPSPDALEYARGQMPFPQEPAAAPDAANVAPALEDDKPLYVSRRMSRSSGTASLGQSGRIESGSDEGSRRSSVSQDHSVAIALQRRNSGEMTVKGESDSESEGSRHSRRLRLSKPGMETQSRGQIQELDEHAQHAHAPGLLLRARGGSKGGILKGENYRNFTVNIRPSRWDGKFKPSQFWIGKIQSFERAQQVADAIYFYIGREAFHIKDVVRWYPSITCMGKVPGTPEVLSNQEMFRSYTAAIAKGVEFKLQREDFIAQVERVIEMPDFPNFLAPPEDDVEHDYGSYGPHDQRPVHPNGARPQGVRPMYIAGPRSVPGPRPRPAFHCPPTNIPTAQMIRPPGHLYPVRARGVHEMPSGGPAYRPGPQPQPGQCPGPRPMHVGLRYLPAYAHHRPLTPNQPGPSPVRPQKQLQQPAEVPLVKTRSLEAERAARFGRNERGEPLQPGLRIRRLAAFPPPKPRSSDDSDSDSNAESQGSKKSNVSSVIGGPPRPLLASRGVSQNSTPQRTPPRAPQPEFVPPKGESSSNSEEETDPPRGPPQPAFQSRHAPQPARASREQNVEVEASYEENYEAEVSYEANVEVEASYEENYAAEVSYEENVEVEAFYEENCEAEVSYEEECEVEASYDENYEAEVSYEEECEVEASYEENYEAEISYEEECELEASYEEEYEAVVSYEEEWPSPKSKGSSKSSSKKSFSKSSSKSSSKPSDSDSESDDGGKQKQYSRPRRAVPGNDVNVPQRAVPSMYDSGNSGKKVVKSVQNAMKGFMRGISSVGRNITPVLAPIGAAIAGEAARQTSSIQPNIYDSGNSGDGSNIFGDKTCDITLRTDNLEGANDPHGNIEDDYEVFKDQLYEDIKRIDCIEEVAIDHIDIQTLLQSQGIVILSFFDENEEIFEFYFKNREDMASIVGVGLEYAMVILESGEVTIEEIIEEDWNQRWRSIETNSCRENKKLFKIMTPTSSYVNEGPIHLDVELSFKKPLLWELTKYFSLRKSIETFVTKDIFVEYAQSVGTSSSTSFKNQAEGSILKGTWKFVTWFINGGSQENENEGSTSNQIEERVVDDGKNSATIVELKLLKEGLDLKDEKVVEPFLGTINSNLQFQFINDAGDRKDEKEIHITVGHVSFTRGRDKDGKQSPWYHDNFQVIFGLLDEEAQNHGEIKGRSFRPLDMKSGTESMKTTSTRGHTKGKESIKKGVVSIAPHIVGLSGEYQQKSGLQNSEMTGSERGVEISNNTYTDGGLALLSSEDQFKIVCDYTVLEDLSHKRPSCHYHDQEVIFEGIWLPTDDGEFSSQFVEYRLQATRAMLYEGKRNQHKYMKSILVNHFMTHLDGKTYNLRERKRNSEGESGSILTESRSWSPPQWSVEPLVEIKDPPIEVTYTTTEHVDQHQTNNMSPQISSWTNRLMNRGRRIVRRDRSTQSGNSFRETSVPESRQEVNGDSNPTRRGSMRW